MEGQRKCEASKVVYNFTTQEKMHWGKKKEDSRVFTEECLWLGILTFYLGLDIMANNNVSAFTILKGVLKKTFKSQCHYQTSLENFFNPVSFLLN